MTARFLSIETLSDRAQALYDGVNQEPDLPCVLIVGSFLDQCLASLLARHLVDHAVSDSLLSGALSRFRIRAELTFSLGLIPESLMKNLVLLAEIRNRFAHSFLSKTFGEPEIERLCSALTFPEVAANVLINGDTGAIFKPEDPWFAIEGARARFTVVSVLMAQRLMLTGLSVAKKELYLKGWS